ncbi:hypothetical protein NE235_16110 [Actinoallomurus spadix]|uniref:Uncharacterized protein n=1 Tax=Actinoallomurus spadix TaxID=79912 RepID=A0ABN0XI61_9ACTN|nr:hypothetical protein [Actinoallomurus spadix]MCO5987626.1 hypothetical protein [Actinoallomurus spadix]
MGTVMHLLMIRFALVVGGVVLLVIAGFTVAVTIERRGRWQEARRYVEPLLRALAREDRDGRPAGVPPGRRSARGGARRAAARTLLGYLEDRPARDGKGTGR